MSVDITINCYYHHQQSNLWGRNFAFSNCLQLKGYLKGTLTIFHFFPLVYLFFFCLCLRFQLACWSYGELLELSIQRRYPRQPSQQIQGAFHKTPKLLYCYHGRDILRPWYFNVYHATLRHIYVDIVEVNLLCPCHLVCAWQVTNVDDEGNELGSGTMELTQTELILHTRKRDAIRWPYLCLRRYGYDSNLFSFESGRRCQTGQGEIALTQDNPKCLEHPNNYNSLATVCLCNLTFLYFCMCSGRDLCIQVLPCRGDL